MNKLIQQLSNIPKGFENQIAIETSGSSITYTGLAERVKNSPLWLTNQGVNSVALHANNSIDWVVVDLACLMAQLILTPIPLFFTQSQYDQLLLSVKPDILFSQKHINFGERCDCEQVALGTYKLIQDENLDAPKCTAKITYTSGSTGTPKGVCLSDDNQLAVASALVTRIGLEAPRHLCLLPLPTLLENIAGVYCPLLACGTVVIASDAERGFEGSRLINPNALLSCISNIQPNSLILVPELLQVLVMATKNNWPPPSSLKFIAVGGSRVSASLLADARRLGLPVYQGYGLSECSSVVCINTPNNDDLLCAGLSSFVAFEDTKPALINDLIQTNLITPMLFTQAFVAKSTSNTAEQSAPKPLCVIQVGSAFGYIGYPGFSAYCASKFGLRGFTQALAREYSDTAIRFGYFAPHATNTDINAASVDDMNKALGNSVDSVNVVAKAFITFLNSNKREQVVGWPETLFARINGFIPKLVDNAIQSKLSIIKGYLKQSVQP